ncbi:somatostatin-1 isoform X1 [Xyrichtys novacula]|uniref:Somatostatin-1 isoform X1 n=1 Tax=Xyrichtys novacula TaxID=13765 RepID=A0AAV1HN36_XYRNO|nr:somatostatin-1 isoform X1 [Xyrichtys novacula]
MFMSSWLIMTLSSLVTPLFITSTSSSPHLRVSPPITCFSWPEDEEDLEMKRSIYQRNTSYSNSVNTPLLHCHFIIVLLYPGSISTSSSGWRGGSLFEVEMLHRQFQLFLVVFFPSLLLLEISAVPRPDMLMGTLRGDFSDDKDLAPFLLLKFMSGLMATRGDEMLPEQEEVLRRHLPLASYRERKAGCRHFFWKTFTSC